jgi:hypothetical protein
VYYQETSVDGMSSIFNPGLAFHCCLDHWHPGGRWEVRRLKRSTPSSTTSGQKSSPHSSKAIGKPMLLSGNSATVCEDKRGGVLSALGWMRPSWQEE